MVTTTLTREKKKRSRPLFTSSARNRKIFKTLMSLRNTNDALLWILNKNESARKGDILLIEEAPYPMFSLMFSIPPCSISHPIKYHISCLHKRKQRLVNANWVEHSSGIRIVFANRDIRAGERWYVAFAPFFRDGPLRRTPCEETERENRLAYLTALSRRTYIPRTRYL